MSHVKMYVTAMVLLLVAAATVQHASLYTLILFLAGIVAGVVGLLLEQKVKER